MLHQVGAPLRHWAHNPVDSGPRTTLGVHPRRITLNNTTRAHARATSRRRRRRLHTPCPRTLSSGRVRSDSGQANTYKYAHHHHHHHRSPRTQRVGALVLHCVRGSRQWPWLVAQAARARAVHPSAPPGRPPDVYDTTLAHLPYSGRYPRPKTTEFTSNAPTYKKNTKDRRPT